MLDDSPLYAVIPVSDLDDARRFYEDVLEILYRAGDTRFAVYPSEGPGSARHTLGSFIVEDIETVAAELRTRGVVFEEYDEPELKTVKGIARLGADKVAFFKDLAGTFWPWSRSMFLDAYFRELNLEVPPVGDCSGSARRSAIPTVVGPTPPDQPAHDHDYRREGEPEIDH